MKRVAMLWRVIPTPRRFIFIPPIPATVSCLLGLCVVLFTLDGCFFFRTKPDTKKAQEMAGQLSPGMTIDEVLALLGSPQRRGQNLFDKRKEYWIYELDKEEKNTKKRSRDTDRNHQETVVTSELQLLFERGKLVNWNVVPIKE
jgi:outer membrane protein assembly factor BamE (lipoprotein component of BamABCDE complex)